MHRDTFRFRILAPIAALCLLAATSSALAQFLEEDVQVLASFATEAVGDSYGWVGTTLGDINDDGAPEYIITAPFNNEGGAIAGKVYVYNGADGSLIATQLGLAFDTLGWGIAAGGDFDADGVPDYAAGGPAVFGGGNGKVVFYSGADHTVLHTVDAPIRNLLGYDLGIAGDIDGDGRDDLIAGALTEAVSAPAAGRVSILSGKDASVIWAADGNGAVALLGGGVSGLCDLNGDGVPEQAAAAFRAGNQGLGQAYVYNGADGALLMTFRPNGSGAGAFGQFFVHDAGDVNADGLCDIYVGDFSDQKGGRGYVFSGADGSRLRLINADTVADGLGMGRGAGDVDGDGHDDLLIGAYLAPDAAVQGGEVKLISGKNGQERRAFTGTVAIAQLGFDVVTLGDVNGDGITDFLITGNEVAHVVAGIELDANGDN